MTKRKRPADPISRAFRQDFPQFVDRAKTLGVRISLSPGKRTAPSRCYWLDGYRQLTGYTTKSDGSPFRHEDAVQSIDKALTEIEADRELVSAMSVPDRFARVMEQMRKVAPQYRMIGEVRLPCGDGGHCFFMADYDGGVRLHGVGDVARANADWRREESYSDHMARFCDLLQADFQRRHTAAEDAA